MLDIEAKMKIISQNLKKARNSNQQAVIAERRNGIKNEHFNTTKNIGYSKGKSNYFHKNDESSITAEKAHYMYKKEDKIKEISNNEQFSSRALYKALSRRIHNLANIRNNISTVNIDHDPSKTLSIDGYKSNYVPSKERVDLVVTELEYELAKRKKFSRRRTYRTDKDVDSINERNARFNEKLSRAFDRYTGEIKDNLKRGTAIPHAQV